MSKKHNFADTFTTIQGWMVSELDLKGNELITFAVIFGFCQDGETEFKGSINYIKKWLNVGSRNTVIKAADSLVEKGLIIKRQEEISGVTFNRYMVDFDKIRTIRKNCIGSAETEQGVVQKLNRGSSETEHSNIKGNIEGNSFYSKDEEKIKNDWEEKGMDRKEQALQEIYTHLKANPDKWKEIANRCRINVNKVQFSDELKEWVAYNQDNYNVMNNAVLRLEGGKNSFVLWLRQTWTVEKYNGKQTKSKQQTDQPAAPVYDGDASGNK